MKLLRHFTICLSLFCHLLLVGQSATQSLPLSWDKNFPTSDVPGVKLSAVDVQALIEEDAYWADQGDKSLRFGLDIPVAFSAQFHGLWQLAPNGESVWRFSLYAPGAMSLNFIFKTFRLPAGGRLFVYAENDKSQLLGPFTDLQHNPDSNFATLPIRGSRAFIEYNGPAQPMPLLELAYVIYGYKDFWSTAKAFNASGACNVNVVCPEAQGFENQIRSVVMLLTSNNSRFCSGALINNTANDRTPYVLTARHCTPGTTNIFMFNYQSAICSPSQDGNTFQTLQGCALIANNAGTDFSLVRLNSNIPNEYDAYFAGWSRQTEGPATATGIHHPAGDVKKITFNYDETTTATYSNADCWRIPSWELGTTEGGSSGSPLFNEDGQIIGQLYGGTASCSNNIDDFYGRLCTSWNGTQPNRRLSDWLDPLGLNPDAWPGIEAAVDLPALDTRISFIQAPAGEYCNESQLQPAVGLRNNGTDTITQVNIGYRLNNGALNVFSWSGQLLTYQTVTVILPSINIAEADNQLFSAYTFLPNGQPDQRPENDTLTSVFRSASGKNYRLRLVSDNFPEETWFQLRNSAGQIIYSIVPGSLPLGISNFEFCLNQGCYTLIMRDTYGDGMSSPMNGIGSYTLFNEMNDVVVSGGVFGTQIAHNFCVDTIVSLGQAPDIHSVLLYPNPTSGLVTLAMDVAALSGSLEYRLHSYDGKMICSGTKSTDETISWTMEQLPAGIYLLSLKINQHWVHKRLVLAP